MEPDSSISLRQIMLPLEHAHIASILLLQIQEQELSQRLNYTSIIVQFLGGSFISTHKEIYSMILMAPSQDLELNHGRPFSTLTTINLSAK
jgi:hypothetical protein